MNKLKWWLRIVGGWYMLLGLSGLAISFVSPEMYATGLPPTYAKDELATAASIDMNFLVMLVFTVVAVMAFVASREPDRARYFIWMMVCFEFFAYAAVNLIWIYRSWQGVLPFFILHLIFGTTGLIFLLKTRTPDMITPQA